MKRLRRAKPLVKPDDVPRADSRSHWLVGRDRDSAPCSSFVVSGSLIVARLDPLWPGAGWVIAPRPGSLESRLSPQARAIIRDFLEPGESLADAATWADENSREIPGSAAWHFVNVRISSPHYSPRDCRPQGCVVTKIAEFRTILADQHAPRSRRRMALRFFVHLVQDLHQPMHVADRNDRGGNNLQLRYGRYDNTNLHQVWDSGLLRQAVSPRNGPRP